ncbi:MAG: imidazole glycerol phosphate synthase subunit HisF [Deltaproteobacteria bacterium]|nr:MAG: imidazole glycerol phosphate synthase subunit HisF [Deltaproteobacteria bacterium]
MLREGAMLAIRIIPCLDVASGRVVKGVRFCNLCDAGDPATLAARYSAEGADEIVFLDVTATCEGRLTDLQWIREIRKAIDVPFCVGGGIDSTHAAARCLEAGADKVAVNTAAVERPELIGRLAAEFGSQCTVLALDARKTAAGWEVVTHSGQRRTGRDAIEWAKEACTLGAGEILLTSFDRDGTRGGYELELIRSTRSAVDVPLIASGGADNPRHMVEAIRAGADAVLAASIFHFGDYTIAGVKEQLNREGLEVRTC